MGQDRRVGAGSLDERLDQPPGPICCSLGAALLYPAALSCVERLYPAFRGSRMHILRVLILLDTVFKVACESSSAM